jgi:hypothetical protein
MSADEALPEVKFGFCSGRFAAPIAMPNFRAAIFL